MRATLKFATVLAGAIGTLTVTAATISPQDADSNVTAWLRLLGIDNPPAALVTSNADHVITLFGVALLLLTAMGIYEWMRPKRSDANGTFTPHELADLISERLNGNAKSAESVTVEVAPTQNADAKSAAANLARIKSLRIRLRRAIDEPPYRKGHHDEQMRRSSQLIGQTLNDLVDRI